MTIRAYAPADFPIVEQWAKARNMAIVPQLLSPNGFLVEDERGPLAVCWVYLTFDCPVAMVDNLFTRPGASLKKGLAAWRIMWSAIQSFLSNLKDCNGDSLNYSIVRVFCRSPLSRFLKGWDVTEHQYSQAIFTRHG